MAEGRGISSKYFSGRMLYAVPPYLSSSWLGRENHGPPVSKKFMTSRGFHCRLMLSSWISFGEWGAMTSTTQLRAGFSVRRQKISGTVRCVCIIENSTVLLICRVLEKNSLVEVKGIEIQLPLWIRILHL